MSVIETKRLTLRELDCGDAPFILRLLNEEPFLRFIGDKGVRTLADAREYILKGPVDSYRRFGLGLYLTSLRDTGSPIGICGLVKRNALPTSTWVCLPGRTLLQRLRHRSRGGGPRARDAGLHLDRIVAITAPNNGGSIAVLEKIGFEIRAYDKDCR